MSSPLVKLTAAVIELPAKQREVLLPLFTWGLLKNAPKGSCVPPALAADVEAFFASLGSDPEQWNEALEKRLTEAGVTSATLRDLAVLAGTPDIDSRSVRAFADRAMPVFQPSAAPSKDQTRAGPGARFSLEQLLAAQKKGES